MALMPGNRPLLLLERLVSVAKYSTMMLAFLLAHVSVAPVVLAVDRGPVSINPASQTTGTYGSPSALQLYKNCVLRSLLRACSDLIERGKTPGFSNVYSVAAAYYKRGSLKAQKDQFDAALADYRIAASLFPFPQLDLEIAQLEKRKLSASGDGGATQKIKDASLPVAQKEARTRTTLMNPAPQQSHERQKAVETIKSEGSSIALRRQTKRQPAIIAAAAKTAKGRRTRETSVATSKTLANRETAKPNSKSPSVAEIRITPKTNAAISATPPARNSDAVIPKPVFTHVTKAAPSKNKQPIWSAADVDWETITERVIHRHRTRTAQKTNETAKELTELRGTCNPEQYGNCAPSQSELSIADAEYFSASQHVADIDGNKRATGVPSAMITTGSLPSFQVMSGLRRTPESAIQSPASRPIPLNAARAPGMTNTAQSVRVSMIARPALVLREPAENRKWGPSLLHYIILLLVCSISTGMFVVLRNRSERLMPPAIDFADDAAGSQAGPLRDCAAAMSRVVVQRSPRQDVGADTTVAHIASSYVEPVTQSLNHLAPVVAAVSAADTPRLGEPDRETNPPQPIRHALAEPVRGSNTLETQSLNGNTLIVASADDARRRLVHSALRAVLADASIPARSTIVLDGTGHLKDRLMADPRLQDRMTIIDWGQPEFAGSLNPFSVMGLDKEPLAREQALNTAFEIQCHVIEGFLGTNLVAQTRSQLRHLFRLMSVVPSADFATLRDLLQQRDVQQYQQYIALLNSKTSDEFFKSEFSGKGLDKIAAALVPALDELLADETLANAILAPVQCNADRQGYTLLNVALTVVPFPVDHVNSAARSVLRRMCLARAMDHWQTRVTASSSPSCMTLVIDTLSDFEVPALLGFSQMLRHFTQNGSCLIVGEREISSLPSGVLAHVAQRATNQIIDSSSAHHLPNLMGALAIEGGLIDDLEWDDKVEQALLLRTSDHRQTAEMLYKR